MAGLIGTLKAHQEPTELLERHGFKPSHPYGPDACHLVLIDDNLYYRSMRREFVPIARTHATGLAIVSLQVSEEEAMERNCRRIDQGGEVHPCPDPTLDPTAGCLPGAAQ